jgi:hypothetical protein
MIKTILQSAFVIFYTSDVIQRPNCDVAGLIGAGDQIHPVQNKRCQNKGNDGVDLAILDSTLK